MYDMLDPCPRCLAFQARAELAAEMSKWYMKHRNEACLRLCEMSEEIRQLKAEKENLRLRNDLLRTRTDLPTHTRVAYTQLLSQIEGVRGNDIY